MKDRWTDKTYSTTLSELVESDARDCQLDGVAESALERAKKSIHFTEKLTELLYKKGLLDEKDIESLVSSISPYREEYVSVTP
jgi:hypothetical protein